MIQITDLIVQKQDFQLKIEQLRIKHGLTVLIGENGAGKSTLLHVLSTAIESNQGEVSYAGKSLLDSLPLIRSQIGFCPTGLELYEEMTPRKFLIYMSRLKGMPLLKMKKRIGQLIHEFRLEEIADQKIRNLSEGMKQQVAIAQTIINQPAFVFLDEPCHSLDIQERNHLVSYFSVYADRKVVLVATHEFSLWEKYCDSVLWVSNGKIRFYGKLDEWQEIGEKKYSMEEAYFVRKNTRNQ